MIKPQAPNQTQIEFFMKIGTEYKYLSYVEVVLVLV